MFATFAAARHSPNSKASKKLPSKPPPPLHPLFSHAFHLTAAAQSYQNGENHRQDSSIASQCKLLLPRVLPAQDPNGGTNITTNTPLIYMTSTLNEDGIADDKMVSSGLGSGQPPSPSGTYGAGASPSFRHGYLGCRREHCWKVTRVSGDLSAPIAVNDMFTFDVHEYEPGFGRRSAG